MPDARGPQRGLLHAAGQDRPERDEVCVDSRMRLNVGVLRAEQGAGVPGGDRLHPVDHLAARVEPTADRALGVLVRQPVPHREQHRGRRVVLRCDQLELAPLRRQLTGDRRRNVGLGGRDDIQGRCERDSRRVSGDRDVYRAVHDRAPSGGISLLAQAHGLPGYSRGPLPGGAPPERQSRPVTTVVRAFGTAQADSAERKVVAAAPDACGALVGTAATVSPFR